MPDPNDPWAAYRPENQAPRQPQPQPQPFPSANPGIPMAGNPARVEQRGQAQIRTGIDIDQNARAATALGFEQERLRITQDEADRKKSQLAVTGGIEADASERQGAARAYMLKGNLDIIQKLQKQFPDALKPGLQETAGQLASNAWLQDAAIPPSIREARMAMNNAYRDFTQTAIYSASGAAFNDAELQTKIRVFTPSYWDSPMTLEVKKQQMELAVGGAMLQAGSTRDQVEMSLTQLREATAPLFTSKQAPAPEDEKFKTSSENQAIPPPPEMQAEFNAWMERHPPGTLTVGDFSKMYSELTSKYERGFDQGTVLNYVEKYNKGQASTKIPASEKPLSDFEKGVAEVSKSETGTFLRNAANAGSGGIPMLLAGQEGRFASNLADKENPKSALAGDVLGSIAPVVGLEAAAAKLFSSGVVKLGTGLAANATYGGMRGATEAEPGDRLSGTAIGAGTGILGELGGRALAKGAKGFIGKEKADVIEELTSEQGFEIPSARSGNEPALPKSMQGLPEAELQRVVEHFDSVLASGEKLAPEDQMLRDVVEQHLAKSNAPGQGTIPKADPTTMQRAGMGSAEEFVQGLPAVGRAREASMASISSKRAAKILSNVGIELPKDVAPGRETIAFLQESLGKEYDKLSPFIRGSVDKTFSNAVAALRTKALQGGGPERLAAWSDVEAAVKQFNSKKGAFDGEGYKELTGRLEIIAEKLAKDGKDVAALDVAQAADGIKDQALTLVGRNNPAAYRRLKRIDRSYAQFKTEQRASLAGPVRSEHGVTTPEDTLAAMQNRDTSIDKGEFAAGKIPGQKEVETLRDVTGGRPAKRGSILQTTGVSYVAGAGFVATLGALAYSPGVKRVTQAIIDGKGGATPKAIEQSLQKTSAGRRILRTLDADARQKLYTQLIREKTRESAQD